MGKLVHCKTCGAEIAKSAKVCPVCGARRKKHRVLGIVLIIFSLALLGSVLANTEDDKGPQKVGADDGTQQTTFGVGDAVALNDIVVTLNDVSDSSGSQYNKPADGNVFALCNFTIENNSNKEIAVSSLVSFRTYVDDTAVNMSMQAVIDADNGQLDGTIAAGKKMVGTIGYEVPADYKELEIRFTPDFWNKTEIIFVSAK